jgi:hypothetical protein
MKWNYQLTANKFIKLPHIYCDVLQTHKTITNTNKMNETKRKKPGPSLAFLGLLLLLSTGVSRVAAMRGPVVPENEYLIHKLNLQLPTVQESIVDSSVLASEHVISVAAGTPAAPIKHITGMVRKCSSHYYKNIWNTLLRIIIEGLFVCFFFKLNNKMYGIITW